MSMVEHIAPTTAAFVCFECGSRNEIEVVESVPAEALVCEVCGCSNEPAGTKS